MVDEQLLQLQHFAAVGRLSAYLLHEISNPLTAALLHLELNQYSPNVESARDNIKLLQRYVEAARQQVSQQDRKQYFCLRPQVEQLKPVVMPLARQTGVQLRLGMVPDCQLYGDAAKFQQILCNLIKNGIDAYGQSTPAIGAKVIVGWDLHPNQLTITVQDKAGGISLDLLPVIFDDFATSKTGRGLGLGLALVKHYVTNNFAGSITVISNNSGSCFRICLPLHPQS